MLLASPLPDDRGPHFQLIGDLLATAAQPLIPYPPPLASRVALAVALAWGHAWLLWMVLEDFLQPGRSIRVLVALAVAAAAVATTDVAVTRYVDRLSVAFRPDPALGWVPSPTTDPAINNRFGLRWPDVPLERTPGVKRILVIGDSATWGTNVRVDETYVAVLADRLGAGWECVNGGIKGYSTLQGLHLARRLVAAYQPDVLMVGFNNDYFMSDRPDRERVPDDPRVLQALQWLYGRGLYMVLRREVGNALAKAPSQPAGSLYRVRRVPLDDYRRNLKGFAALARESGARLVLLVMPSPHAPGYDETVKAVAKEEGAVLVDLNVIWQGDARLRRVLMPDVFHPTPHGHRLIVDVIMERLRREGVTQGP